MILLTGASGFIGSCLLAYLNNIGQDQIIITDEFETSFKQKNLLNKQYTQKVHRAHLFDWLSINGYKIKSVYHLGARTDTVEKNHQIFHQLNLSYSKKIWQFCATYHIPLVYASSAATYGLGQMGFKEDHYILKELRPLNPYAVSKNNFDRWALAQEITPPSWYGLKFFNVYGPNEFHKSRMASVVFHAFKQIKATNAMKLFRSHHPDYADGAQSRDFIYVKDVVDLCHYFMKDLPKSGLYNIGTGRARSFQNLTEATFKAMKVPVNIQFIDTPIDIRDTYQYFTEADMDKTIGVGYTETFWSLEDGIADYVQNYLDKDYAIF